MPERLSPLDVTFLHVEDDVSHMHIGSVGLFEGPAPSQDELLAAIERKLHLAPRYRCRIRFVPLQTGRPVWVDDPHFRLDYHVRRTALPAPGGDAELRRLVGRLMSHQLDRSRPLWEVWIVEGLSGGRWAVLSKLHHAMVDGVAGSSLITNLMDSERHPAPVEPQPWTAAPEPSDTRLVLDALTERARFPLRELESAARALGSPREVLTRTAQTAQGLAALAGLVRAPAPTLLNGPIGPHRRWHWATARLDEVKEIRAALGGTVNDVVLAAITGGFRELLLDAGEPVDRVVRTLVPVSVRSRADSGVYDNQVSAMFADLPVGLEDGPARLGAIHEQLRHLKESHQAVAGQALTGLGGFAPEMLLALGARIATRTPQHTVNTVTTNVPGPQHTLYFAGRRMLETFPYVPLGGHVRVGVAIYSYDGTLGFGVTGDGDAAPNLELLCTGIERGIAELLAAARDASPAPRQAKRAPRARTRA